MEKVAITKACHLLLKQENLQNSLLKLVVRMSGARITKHRTDLETGARRITNLFETFISLGEF